MAKQVRGSDVAVVIPTIEGREELLERALLSVEAQVLRPGQVVVQLDAERRGVYWARNEALKQVDRPWVAWLDDDDELLPHHVRVLTHGASRSGADLVFSYAEFVGGRDPLAVVTRGRGIVAEPINEPWNVDGELTLRKFGNFIPVCYLVRTALVREVGGFPAPYSRGPIKSGECEDYLLLLNLLDAGARFHHVTGVRTWRYHIHGGNLGGRGLDRLHEMATAPQPCAVEEA